MPTIVHANSFFNVENEFCIRAARSFTVQNGRQGTSSSSSSSTFRRALPLYVDRGGSNLDIHPNAMTMETYLIELDFEETSGLSDMNSFNKAQTKGKEKKLSSRNGPVNSAMSAGGSAGSGLESSLGPLTMNGKAKGQKKTRKEKEVEKREQIENSWDAPAPVPNPLPSPDIRRLSSEQMYISDNLDVHIVTICHEHSLILFSRSPPVPHAASDNSRTPENSP
ncbi:hypothetical protein JOM56_012562 [Amanita muscaria]